MWPKPGLAEPQPKLSYVEGFAPWGWIIGTGVYIDDIDAAVRSKALVLGSIGCTILALARALGIEVIAEGIETAQQRAALRTMGCEFGQGYLLGLPSPMAAPILTA